MSPRTRESMLVLLALTLGLFALAWNDVQSGRWNPVALHAWSEAIRNADVTGGARWALAHSFPWLPTVTLWPFTIVEATRTPLAPYAVSAVFTGAFAALVWFRVRARHLRLGSAMIVGSIVFNPVITEFARSGDFRAPVLFLWALLCVAARDACEIEDARSLLTLAGVAGMAWFCDAKFLLLLMPFVPLCALLMPSRVLRDAPAAGYLVLLFPSAASLIAVVWIGMVTPGQGSPFASWTARTPDSATYPLCLAAAVLTGLPFLQNQRRRLCATLAAIPLAAACLNLAFSTEPQPVFFAALLTGPVVLWCEDRISVPKLLPALALLLWLVPPAPLTTPVDRDRELAQWLREHPRATVLADDRALGAALAFAGSARNLIVPDTPEFELQTASRTPQTDFVIEAGRITVDRVRHGYALDAHTPSWRIWRRVAETQDLAATY